MADNTILKLGLFAGAGYLFWRTFLQPATTAAATSSSSPGTLAPAPASPAVSVTDDMLPRLIAAANAPPEGLGPDAWNWFLMNKVAPGLVAPDPLAVWGPSLDRSKPISANDYWSAIKSYLHVGMGAYIGRRRRVIPGYDEYDPEYRNGDIS